MKSSWGAMQEQCVYMKGYKISWGARVQSLADATMLIIANLVHVWPHRLQ